MKYLFITEYKDNSVFEQNKEDVSLIDPIRSSFYDVLNSGKEIKTFKIVGEGNVFFVSLEDGHFEVNGTPFYMHDMAMPLKDFKLIYYRKHTHSFNMTKELSHEIDYCIGWEAKMETGKNIKRIMEVK